MSAWHPRFRYGLIAVVVMINSASGCRSTDAEVGPPSLDDLHVGAVPLEGTVLVQEDWLVAPAALRVLDGQLFVGDAAVEPFIHVVDLESRGPVIAWGRRGEGPGEFSTVASLTQAGDQLWAFDPNERRLSAVRPDAKADEIPIVTFEGDRSLIDPTWTSDSSLVALVFAPDYRLGIFDATGRELSIIGVQPQADDVPTPMLPYLNHSRIAVHPEKGLVFLAARWSSRVSVIRLDGSSETESTGPAVFQSAFDFVGDDGRPIMAAVDETRSGYIDIAATADRVYALFSGRRFGDFGGEAGYGEFVHVFEWSGEYLGALQLSAAVASITVDEASNKLYAGQWEPIPAILEYDLPTEFTTQATKEQLKNEG